MKLFFTDILSELLRQICTGLSASNHTAMHYMPGKSQRDSFRCRHQLLKNSSTFANPIS